MRLHVARTRLRNIVKHASEDSIYMQELRKRPVDVLVKEGLPYDVIEDFLQETSIDAEVSGYYLQTCSNSCALTRACDYPEDLR